MPSGKPYRPISCDFHDVLEAAATRRRRVRIEFLEDGQPQLRESRIADLGGGPDGEYMTLEDGQSVRLDRIVSVDGVRLDAFAAWDGDADGNGPPRSRR